MERPDAGTIPKEVHMSEVKRKEALGKLRDRKME